MHSSSPALSSHESLVELIREAQAGSDLSAQKLFERCRQPLLFAIRRVVHPPLRRLYDSDDFLLDAFAEIFTRQFTDSVLESPATFWPYLKRIAENKVLDAQRKHLISQRRNILRDVPLEVLNADLCSQELQPDEILMLKELVEERLVDLIGQLPSLLQQIIQSVLQGEAGVQIASRLGVKPKRVYRAMEWLRMKILEN